MKRELKNFLNYLKDARYKSGDLFHDSDLEWRIVYLFLRRYHAISKELSISKIETKISKYLDGKSDNLWPSDDLFEPFFSFIREKNPSTFENIDLKAYLKKDIESLNSSDIELFEKKIGKFKLNDFSLEAYTIEEFDEFFTSVIELTKSRQQHSYWERTIPKQLSELINKTISNHAVELYVGDQNAQLVFDRNDDESKKIITSDPDLILWYYLRILLTGKENIELLRTEFHGLSNIEADFKFMFPPVGKLDISKLFDWEKPPKKKMHDLELWYANNAVDNIGDNSRALLLMPTHTLYRNSKAFQDFRKKIVDEKYLKTVILFPQGLFYPKSSISYCLLELDSRDKTDGIIMINGTEIAPYIAPRQTEKFDLFFKDIQSYWFDQLAFYPFIMSVSSHDIKKNKYSLAFSYYFNVSNDPVNNTRNRDEDLISLKQVLKEIRTSTEVINDVPYIGISELAKNITEFKLKVDQLPNLNEKERLRRIDQSAIILGKISGNIKPTLFEYEGKSVYIKNNVIAFQIPEEYDLEYILLELRSDFVIKQFQSNSSIRVSELENIFLRIPPTIATQKEIVRQRFSEFAKEKLDEIKGLSKDFEYIEKDVFSSFAHDFGKVLANARASVEILENYVRELAKKGIINCEDSVFFETKPKRGEKVKDVLQMLTRNQDRIQESLQSEVEFFTKSNNERLERLNLSSIISEWVSRQVQNGFYLEFYDLSRPHDNRMELHKKGESSGSKTMIEGSREDIFHIMNNFLSNAKEHGFYKDEIEDEFIVIIDEVLEGDEKLVVLHVGNDGEPFPEDFSCEDLFKLNHKGPTSKGEGKGGNSIKRKLDRMGATINCHSNILENDGYTVHFEIKFKAVNYE